MNNAAITKDGLALRMKKDDWDAVIATNLTGAFLAMQQVLQGMMKERWGRIVNISVVAEAGIQARRTTSRRKRVDRTDEIVGSRKWRAATSL